MGNKKIWVPMPASQLYGQDGAPAGFVRDRLVAKHGAETVLRAEVACLLDVIMMTGIIRPTEFIDLMQKKLHRIEEERRAAVNLDSDRG